jgi:hypothetical protein
MFKYKARGTGADVGASLSDFLLEEYKSNTKDVELPKWKVHPLKKAIRAIIADGRDWDLTGAPDSFFFREFGNFAKSDEHDIGLWEALMSNGPAEDSDQVDREKVGEQVGGRFFGRNPHPYTQDTTAPRDTRLASAVIDPLDPAEIIGMLNSVVNDDTAQHFASRALYTLKTASDYSGKLVSGRSVDVVRRLVSEKLVARYRPEVAATAGEISIKELALWDAVVTLVAAKSEFAFLMMVPSVIYGGVSVGVESTDMLRNLGVTYAMLRGTVAEPSLKDYLAGLPDLDESNQYKKFFVTLTEPILVATERLVNVGYFGTRPEQGIDKNSFSFRDEQRGVLAGYIFEIWKDYYASYPTASYVDPIVRQTALLQGKATDEVVDFLFQGVPFDPVAIKDIKDRLNAASAPAQAESPKEEESQQSTQPSQESQQTQPSQESQVIPGGPPSTPEQQSQPSQPPQASPTPVIPADIPPSPPSTSPEQTTTQPPPQQTPLQLPEASPKQPPPQPSPKQPEIVAAPKQGGAVPIPASPQPVPSTLKPSPKQVLTPPSTPPPKQGPPPVVVVPSVVTPVVVTPVVVQPQSATPDLFLTLINQGAPMLVDSARNEAFLRKIVTELSDPTPRDISFDAFEFAMFFVLGVEKDLDSSLLLRYDYATRFRADGIDSIDYPGLSGDAARVTSLSSTKLTIDAGGVANIQMGTVVFKASELSRRILDEAGVSGAWINMRNLVFAMMFIQIAMEKRAVGKKMPGIAVWYKHPVLSRGNATRFVKASIISAVVRCGSMSGFVRRALADATEARQLMDKFME